MLRSILAISVIGALSAGAYAASDLSSQINALQMQVNKLQSQINNSSKISVVSVATYSPFTWQLLDNTVGTGTEMSILKARQVGNLANSTFYFGGIAKADAIYEHTNTLDRFADVSNGSGSASATELNLTQAALDTVANLNNWTTAYLQIGETNVGGYHRGYGFGLGKPISRHDYVNFQKAYLLFGNLNQSPFYGVFGKKEVDFGSFASVNMYVNPLNRIVYEPSANQAAIGFAENGFNNVASVTNGGSSGRNLFTTSRNQMNNFAINSTYDATNNGVDWKVGAGYLNGSGFLSDDNGVAGRNIAWDVNSSVAINNLTVIVEYTANVDAEVSDVGSAGKPSAYDLGASYTLPVLSYHSILSADYSHLRANANDEHTANFGQYVVGFRTEVLSNIWAGIEYAYNNGIYSSNLYDYNIGGYEGVTNAKNNTVLFDLTAIF